eukprot:CAMPEP_0196651816 /NCGR_PEP_ID=MMETSP1086-20130531/954_1 /TAXON_ID=77921 /ORGANISM="Cyanoptyche  gloeocystis , Strain SAG4.97" /LENGTH=45 /DNA_ID= /DNA_START= /DNA_END= /DNA_ORIENTATION=
MRIKSALFALLALACAVAYADDFLGGNTDVVYPLFGIATITGNYT